MFAVTSTVSNICGLG